MSFCVSIFLKDKMNITGEIYDKYAFDQKTFFDTRMKQSAEQRTKLQLNHNSISAKLNAFILNDMSKNKDDIE